MHTVPADVLFSLLIARPDDYKNMARQNLHAIEMQLHAVIMFMNREVYITYYLEK